MWSQNFIKIRIQIHSILGWWIRVQLYLYFIKINWKWQLSLNIIMFVHRNGLFSITNDGFKRKLYTLNFVCVSFYCKLCTKFAICNLQFFSAFLRNLWLLTIKSFLTKIDFFYVSAYFVMCKCSTYDIEELNQSDLSKIRSGILTNWWRKFDTNLTDQWLLEDHWLTPRIVTHKGVSTVPHLFNFMYSHLNCSDLLICICLVFFTQNRRQTYI